MKKVILAIALLAISAGLIYSAQVAKYVRSNFEVTVDSLYTSVDAAGRTHWQPIDTLIIVQTDSAVGRVQISGVAELSSYDILYLGLGSDSVAAKGRANLDTFVIRGDGRGGPEMEYIPFSFEYGYRSLVTDTVYVFAATNMRKQGDDVKIKDGTISAAYVLAVGNNIGI